MYNIIYNISLSETSIFLIHNSLHEGRNNNNNNKKNLTTLSICKAKLNYLNENSRKDSGK